MRFTLPFDAALLNALLIFRSDEFEKALKQNSKFTSFTLGGNLSFDIDSPLSLDSVTVKKILLVSTGAKQKSSLRMKRPF